METLLELLRTRRSIRNFKETQISPDLVEQIMHAGLMSPSSKNSTPWQFIMVDDRETLKSLSECKTSGSRLIAGSALSVVVVADPERSDAWIEDASIASVLMQLEAEDIGLGSCWVHVRSRQTADGGDSEAFVRKLLQVPENLRILDIVAIGVKNEIRKPFDDSRLQWEKIYLNQYGKTE